MANISKIDQKGGEGETTSRQKQARARRGPLEPSRDAAYGPADERRFADSDVGLERESAHQCRPSVRQRQWQWSKQSADDGPSSNRSHA